MESSRSNKEPFTGFLTFNHVLHTAWLNNHALTLKSNTAKYYIGEKSVQLITISNSKNIYTKTTMRNTSIFTYEAEALCIKNPECLLGLVDWVCFPHLKSFIFIFNNL
jgi:hypothetical protein